MSDDLLKRADNCGTIPSIFLVRDLAARVRELESELHFKACIVHDLLPYQERAVCAEATIRDWKVRDEQYEAVVAERDAVMALSAQSDRHRDELLAENERLRHDLDRLMEREAGHVQEIEELRALLRTCPYEVNKPQSIADAQWVRDVRAALGGKP